MEMILLNKEDVAKLLGINPRTVDNLVKAGKLPGSINIGRQRRWRRQDIEAWLNEAFQSVAGEEKSSNS